MQQFPKFVTVIYLTLLLLSSGGYLIILRHSIFNLKGTATRDLQTAKKIINQWENHFSFRIVVVYLL